MEKSIGKLCKSLGSFCNHLEISCDALKQSTDRRPIPLDSASTTFVQCLNRRVSSTGSDLSLLESMSFGTVSFEELLGHCNEVFKKNHNDLLQLEERLKSFGYVPGGTDEGEEEEESNVSHEINLGFKTNEDEFLFEDSLSLQNLGLSDVCLATIASEAKSKLEIIPIPSERFNSQVIEEDTEDDLKHFEVSISEISISKDDYESLPSYMKCLSSREDLLAALDKMNSCLREKKIMKGNKFFTQDEITAMGLGPKARSYLLLLVRMNRLVVETVDGTISYRVSCPSS